MKKTLSVLASSLLLLATVGVTYAPAAPNRVGAAQVSIPAASQGPTDRSPFRHPDQLSVDGVRLGMTRADVHHSHRPFLVDEADLGFDLKFDHSAHVCFVTGLRLEEAGHDMGSSFEPTRTIHTWGRPLLQGTASQYDVAVYRAGRNLVILRYEPSRLDRRSGIIGEFAMSTDTAWVPYDWGHSLLQGAGL